MDNDNENYLSVDEEGAIEFYPGKYIIRTQLEAIKQLASQQMVAIFQGESEIGPRALGNRSLMFDPTNPRAKVIVNEIKEREGFRPFAGTILLEYFEEYFVTEGIEEFDFTDTDNYDFEPTFDYDNRVVIGSIEFNNEDYIREPIIELIEKTFKIIDDTEENSAQ